MNGGAKMFDDGYYHCERLLTMKDKYGNTPDIYIVDGNRTAGKSYSIKCRQVSDFLKDKYRPENQFIYLYRNVIDMTECADTYFGDIAEAFDGYVMTEKRLMRGSLVQLFINEEPCGYCLALNIARKYKKMRGLFVNIRSIFFDEYQDEDNIYLPNEVNKLLSLCTTISSGHGKQHRRVILYMSSNTVSLLNPYYKEFGINKMLKKDTKFLRGDGWVFERTYNENASTAYKESGIARAFKHASYNEYASENKYLNDNECLIGKPSGQSRYICTIKYNDNLYNVRKYDVCLYVATGADDSFPTRICFTKTDVIDNTTIRVNSTHYIVTMLREYFNRGLLLFENLECKNMIFDVISF